ncbi:MAG: response regulator transcription factor [Ferruginibacter sp.]|nr:response regulator transcription factor [Ferruginibacter sp.]
MKKVLLVEDDLEISGLLSLHFKLHSYQFSCCADGMEALDRIKSETFDLLILDITLPGISGIEICRKVRTEDSLLPIMMLTSNSDEMDKVLALELGADDYVTKPFGIMELMARTKALLRRRSIGEVTDVVQQQDLIFKDLCIDQKKRKASLKNKRLDLTPKEFDLLQLLATNPGKTYSRNELLELIWGMAFAGYEHTITSHINRLRIKIEPDLQNPQYILTSWGTGYRFSE